MYFLHTVIFTQFTLVCVIQHDLNRNRLRYSHDEYSQEKFRAAWYNTET